MKRKLWQIKRSTKKNFIQYPCPSCEVGILKWHQEIPQRDNKRKETIPHRQTKHVFSGLLKCSSCNRLISFGGIYHKGVRFISGSRVKFINEYEPRYFFPNLSLFSLTGLIPISIREEINLSFSLFFSDLSSCANRIRTTIELILDEINASEYHMPEVKSKCPLRQSSCSSHTTSTHRKRKYFRNLHQRIEYYSQKKDEKLGNLMLANKIIGNEGSHKGIVRVEDILDSYEILEEILNRLYIKSDLRIDNIAEEITILKKPRSKK